MGPMRAVILARSSDDFPAIRQEADRLRAIFMAGHPNFDLLYRGQPDTYFVAAQRYSANNPPAVKEAVRQYILTLLVLLIVPAVNLSGLTLSRMRKRISEIGVRKAFGIHGNGKYWFYYPNFRRELRLWHYLWNSWRRICTGTVSDWRTEKSSGCFT